jgi:hypothetical protein
MFTAEDVWIIVSSLVGGFLLGLLLGIATSEPSIKHMVSLDGKRDILKIEWNNKTWVPLEEEENE